MRRGLQGYAGQGPTGPGDRRPGSSAVAAVAVVGAGAAGTLTAIHLVDRAVRADRALHLVLVDPRPEPGRGVAYSTSDRRHLLNVPAGGMSALPDQPGHLVDVAARARPRRRHARRLRPAGRLRQLPAGHPGRGAAQRAGASLSSTDVSGSDTPARCPAACTSPSPTAAS